MRVLLVLSTLAICHHYADGLAPALLQSRSIVVSRQFHGVGCITSSSSPHHRHHHQRRSVCSTSLFSSNNEDSSDVIADDSENNSSVSKKELQDIDIDGTISSWSRLVSALPKLKRSNNHQPDELDKKILATALPTMLNLMVVP